MTKPEQTHSAQPAAGDPPAVGTDAAAAPDPRDLLTQFIRAASLGAPADWESLHAAISMAGGEAIAQVVAMTPGGAVTVTVDRSALEPLRLHRQLTAEPRGPWLRLLVDHHRCGTLDATTDHGDTELPPDHLLSAEAYRADLAAYPRPDVPVWLLAHIGNDDQQIRTAATAHAAAAADASELVVADNEIPPLPLLWSRMAVLIAVSHAVQAPVALRGDPSFQCYATDNGGCTLGRPPGGRGVLSGGSTDSRLLSAAYTGAIAWPELYRGAPAWLHNLYLDPRAGRGLLSFCYWWDGHHWYRAALPETGPLAATETPWQPIEEITRGVPGVWSPHSTADLVLKVLGRIVDEAELNTDAALTLVAAAESRIVSPTHLTRLFLTGVPDTFDMAEALAQLDTADVLLPAHPPCDQHTAKDRVVEHCRAQHISTDGYPLERMSATRIPAGWQIVVPVDPNETTRQPMTFLVADDGVVDTVAPAQPNSQAQLMFAARFAQRIRPR